MRRLVIEHDVQRNVEIAIVYIAFLILGYPRRQRTHREHVLNGIAYDAKNKRLFVTGKNWPKLYEVENVTPR